MYEERLRSSSLYWLEYFKLFLDLSSTENEYTV